MAFNADSWFCGADNRDMRAFMHRFEQPNFFVTAENRPHSQFMQWITLYRADPQAHCTETERQLLEQLAPHVMAALALNRVMHLQSVEVMGAPIASRGAAIADVRGVLYHADPQFMALAQAEWNDWTGPHLPSPLQTAIATQDATYTGTALVVRWQLEHGLLFLRARARCPADQLSPREWMVANLVAQGKNYKEIAQSLQRSPATVRNQIQSIYHKLQVDNIAILTDALRLSR